MDLDEELRRLCDEVQANLPGEGDQALKRCRDDIREWLDELGTINPSDLTEAQFAEYQEHIVQALIFHTAHEEAVLRWALHRSESVGGTLSVEELLTAMRDLFSGPIVRTLERQSRAAKRRR